MMTTSSAEIQAVLNGDKSWCVVVGDAVSLIASMPAEAIDAVVTDPPYGSTGDSSSIVTTKGVVGIPKETQFYEAWAREHLREWVRVLKPAGAAWFTCDWRGAMCFDLAAHKLGHRAPTVGVWHRGGLGMGRVLRKVWEAFVVIPMGKFQPKKTDEPDMWSIPWSPGNRDTGHAAQKPVDLMRRAVELVTSPGNVVLDPFGGSGTTGVAALLSGRRCIVIERDDDYAEVARRRLEACQSQTDWKTCGVQGELFV